MDVLDEELLNFWRILNAHGVRYIMVGRIATRFHGYTEAQTILISGLKIP